MPCKAPEKHVGADSVDSWSGSQSFKRSFLLSRFFSQIFFDLYRIGHFHTKRVIFPRFEVFFSKSIFSFRIFTWFSFFSSTTLSTRKTSAVEQTDRTSINKLRSIEGVSNCQPKKVPKCLQKLEKPWKQVFEKSAPALGSLFESANCSAAGLN